MLVHIKFPASKHLLISNFITWQHDNDGNCDADDDCDEDGGGGEDNNDDDNGGDDRQI